MFPSSPRGTTYVFSQATPLPIPTGPAVVSSDRNVSIPATVCGITVTTTLTHTFAADLDITLTSPAGTVSTLTTDNGAGNDNVFLGTNWYDEADPDGQVPYVTNANLVSDHPYVNLTAATPLVPEEATGAFLGEDAQGTWTITISDDLAGDGGSLDGWDLFVTACSCTNTSRVRRADARASGGSSNVNNVAEPGERFMWDPSVRNTGPAFGENFDFVYRPQIPLAWTETLVTGQTSDLAWRTVNTASFSPPNAAFAADPNHITDNHLDTPNWPVTEVSFFLDITHSYNLEDGFDGGVVEISVNGGPFQDIVTAGGGFFGPGYDGPISVNFGSPIAGRQAFTGSSGGFLRTLAILPNSAIGQNVVFRFRAATDSSVSGSGWWIDNIALGGIASADITAIAGFSGPAGATYTIHDNSADYGTILPTAANNCFDATGDCYELEVSGARPTLHWDAIAVERLSTGNLFGGIPVHIGASFADVSLVSGFYRFIEILLHHGVTSGCGGGNYCPALDIPREQMAVFLLVSKFGAGYTPPACVSPVFNDVPCSHPFATWINELNAQGITSGCGGGNFCPSGPVIREHMAVFLLVSAEGTGYMPPACTTPMFADVPCSNPFSPWVNELSRRGITSGCGGGNFCPAQNVTREQMAVFLAVTFAFDLY
jgi:subtilisin-like proprotein convertase family protein